MGFLDRFFKKRVTISLQIDSGKEINVGVKMTGIWQRKDIEYSDVQAMQRAYSLICRHPYTIATMAEFSQEYAEIYGQDELKVLQDSLRGGKFNMVQSPTKDWVLGGVWVPVPPKVEPVLKEGYEWVNTPFGKFQRPIGTKTPAMESKVTDLDDEVMQKIEATVYKAVTAALEAFANK